MRETIYLVFSFFYRLLGGNVISTALFATQHAQVTFSSPHINWKYPTLSEFVYGKCALITTHSVLKSLLHHCKRCDLCSRASGNVSADSVYVGFIITPRVSGHCRTPTAALPVPSSSGLGVGLRAQLGRRGRDPHVAGTQRGPHATRSGLPCFLSLWGRL